MTAPAGSVSPAPSREPRPDLLAYPAPTTTRYLVLVIALLSAGLFVGDSLHSVVDGPAYLDAERRCQAVAQDRVPGNGSLQEMTARRSAVDTCLAPAERRRAVFVLGGGAATGLAGLAVLYVLPVLIARRRRLGPLDPRLEPARRRVAELAAAAGLRRCPNIMQGPDGGDAFVFGTPGRYVLVLPRVAAVKWRRRDLFDPLVRHELAHIRHGDVMFVWLAQSIWYVVGPALALPVVVGLIEGDGSVLPDYLWRAAVLGITVELVATALLRSREHDADVRAAQWGRPEEVLGLLATLRRLPDAWYQRLMATHPGPARRIAVVRRPGRAAAMTFLDGFAPAFLAAASAPLALSVLFAVNPSIVSTWPIVALIMGALLGGSVGLGLWRASTMARLTGDQVWPWMPAFGVAVGLVAGRLSSLRLTGYGLSGEISPSWFVLVGLAGLGATCLVWSVGEMWADALPAMPRAGWAWGPALLVTGLLYAAACWGFLWLEFLLPAAEGWSLVGSWLLATPYLVLVLGPIAVLGGAVLVAVTARRPGAYPPRWLVERGEVSPWPIASPEPAPVIRAALLAGLAGATVMIGAFLVIGPSMTGAQLAHRYVVTLAAGAAIGVATAIVVALSHRTVGLALGVLAATIATVTTMVGYLLIYGTDLDAGFVADTVLHPVVTGWLVTLALAGPILAIAPRRRRPVRRMWTVTVPAALMVGIAVIAGAAAQPDTARPDTASAARQYIDIVAQQLVVQYEVVETATTAVLDVEGTTSDSARARRIRTEILPKARALYDSAQAYRPPTPAIEMVHRSVLASIQARIESLELFAKGFADADAEVSARAAAADEEARRLLRQWASGLATLQNG